jgi:predicted AlkP superfamily phosphohydrolase/phosphomutase
MKGFVIGLDGATFSVLNPLMEAGYMPNLKLTLAKGVSGDLLSTIPPVTALAWPSFMTGKNPGKHGLLGWQERLNAHFERPWISGTKIRGAKLWHLVGEAGLRVCVVNVPVTYPPEPLNGVMITGMLTPRLKAEFTYPADIQTDLLSAVPDYRIDVDVQRTQPNVGNLEAIIHFLDEVSTTTQARGKAIHWLLKREQPDLAIAVFVMPDRLQHILWQCVEQLPLPLEGIEGATVIQKHLLTCYRVLDEEIGKLVNDLPQEAHLMFLSDHGFGPLNTKIHVNDWLAQQGWLVPDHRRANSWGKLRQIGKYIKRWLPGSLTWRAQQAFPVLRTFDWNRTWAYSGLPTEYGIFLNVYGREPAGIVKSADYESLRTDIIETLKEWLDPRTGQPIMKAIYRREHLYKGPFVDQAPDVVFELQPGYMVSDMPSWGGLLSDAPQKLSGFHEREGIFAMSGPGIHPGITKFHANIQDLLPTLLYTLGLPIPNDLDGRVLVEAFTLAWQAEHPLHSHLTVETRPAFETSRPFSIEDEALLEKRLKGLGYLE